MRATGGNSRCPKRCRRDGSHRGVRAGVFPKHPRQHGPVDLIPLHRRLSRGARGCRCSANCWVTRRYRQPPDPLTLPAPGQSLRNAHSRPRQLLNRYAASHGLRVLPAIAVPRPPRRGRTIHQSAIRIAIRASAAGTASSDGDGPSRMASSVVRALGVSRRRATSSGSPQQLIPILFGYYDVRIHHSIHPVFATRVLAGPMSATPADNTAFTELKDLHRRSCAA